MNYGTEGILLKEVAPLLSKRLYKDNVRFLIGGMSKEENMEAQKIVRFAVKQTKQNNIKFIIKNLDNKCKKFNVNQMKIVRARNYNSQPKLSMQSLLEHKLLNSYKNEMISFMDAHPEVFE